MWLYFVFGGFAEPLGWALAMALVALVTRRPVLAERSTESAAAAFCLGVTTIRFAMSSHSPSSSRTTSGSSPHHPRSHPQRTHPRAPHRVLEERSRSTPGPPPAGVPSGREPSTLLGLRAKSPDRRFHWSPARPPSEADAWSLPGDATCRAREHRGGYPIKPQRRWRWSLPSARWNAPQRPRFPCRSCAAATDRSNRRAP